MKADILLDEKEVVVMHVDKLIEYKKFYSEALNIVQFYQWLRSQSKYQGKHQEVFDKFNEVIDIDVFY